MQPIVDLLQFVFFSFYLVIWTKNFYFGVAFPLLCQILLQWLLGPAVCVDFALTAAYPAALTFVGALVGYLFMRILCLPRPLRRGWCYLIDWVKAFLLWCLLIVAHFPLQIWPLPIYPYGWLLTWAGTQILIFVWLLFAAGQDEFFEEDHNRKVFFWNWMGIQFFMMCGLGVSFFAAKFWAAVASAVLGLLYLLLVILINTCARSKRTNCKSKCKKPCNPMRKCCKKYVLTYKKASCPPPCDRKPQWC
jgi:hypothetical protein